jgi:hypothetical protein
MKSKTPKHIHIKSIDKGKAYQDDHKPDNPDCNCFGCASNRIRLKEAT